MGTSGTWRHELRTADSFEQLTALTVAAAREIAGADGATFVVRDGENCFYVNEDVISPLWKGQRFPITTCISGWAILNEATAVIDDIYADARIPHDAYRPTFVQSLVMVPMGGHVVPGAIGVYWSTHQVAPDQPILHELSEIADEAGRAVRRLDLSTAPWAPTFTRATTNTHHEATDDEVSVAS